MAQAVWPRLELVRCSGSRSQPEETSLFLVRFWVFLQLHSNPIRLLKKMLKDTPIHMHHNGAVIGLDPEHWFINARIGNYLAGLKMLHRLFNLGHFYLELALQNPRNRNCTGWRQSLGGCCPGKS